MASPRRLVADVVVPVDDAGTVWLDAAVEVGADGRIIAAGPLAQLGPSDAEVVDVGGLLMPGLVNAHAHTPMTLVRSAGDGLPLQRWLTESVWPREGRMDETDAWWGMALGSIEMLKAGVTTSCEMYLFEEAVIDAVGRTGGRLVMCPGILASLHADTFGADGGRTDAIATVHGRHHDPLGRITVGFGPHSAYDLAPEQVAEIAQRARSMGALLHIHLEETRAERQQVIDATGRPATLLLAEHGVFDGGRVVAAHGVWVDATERAILADHDVSVVHCPQSNLKLGSGIAPVADYRAAGVRVALGTDGPASNDDLDLWEELKLAPMLARGINHDAAIITAGDALSMATAHGGDALGLDVGRLRSGAWADVVRVDLDQPAFTPGMPEDVIAHLVWAGSSRYVTDVWVAGEQVVRAGVCTTVDEAEARAEVARRGRRLAGRA
jgi:5-methylthioadenosine/S-adenosylhomocysteine deaminase